MKLLLTAKGHPNITGNHKNSIEFSLENDITTRADCVLGVSSVVNKDALKLLKEKVKIRLVLEAANQKEELTAYGSPQITATKGFIIRKSNIIDDKTAAIYADKSAADISREFIDKIKNDVKITVKVEVIGRYEKLDFYEGIKYI